MSTFPVGGNGKAAWRKPTTFGRVLTNSSLTCDQMFDTGLKPMNSVVGRSSLR